MQDNGLAIAIVMWRTFARYAERLVAPMASRESPGKSATSLSQAEEEEEQYLSDDVESLDDEDDDYWDDDEFGIDNWREDATASVQPGANGQSAEL